MMRSLTGLVFLLFAIQPGICDVPDGSAMLKTLKIGHPRLMLSDGALSALKARYDTDTTLRQYADQVKKQADELINKPPLEHRLIGPRLLSVSRDCLNRIYTLGLAWRWTGDERYAKAAKANLLTVAAFPDWNPSHFLDTAEMSNAVGVGYDWLFPYLEESARTTIKTALIEKGLKPGLDAYAKGSNWTTSEFNWNQVCNGGLLVGALAIADTDPQYARAILPRAVASLPKALHAYDPDGAWMEGPGYWHYATQYTAYALCALDTALGSDFGLSEMPGLQVTGHFPSYTTGPTELVLNYADAGERSQRRPMPCMFWLADKFNDPAISDEEHLVARKYGASVMHLVWYTPPSNTPPVERSLDRWFRSPVDILVMRSAWNDPNALFVGVKGGYNQVNHGHLDLGNFELDALGVRWVRDLGSDDYNLPGYWEKRRTGGRWKYFRMRSASHSVPLLGDHDQHVEGKAHVVKFKSKPAEAFARLDLTDAYRDYAQNVTREVALTDNRRKVRIQDRFKLTQPCPVVWGMTTDADIALQNGTTALLTLEGRHMTARILSPRNAAFAVASAEQAKPEKENKGVKRLLIRLDKAKGSVEIVVQLEPAWEEIK